MRFLKSDPPSKLAHLVKEFWMIENPDPAPHVQKVIPDGYCEIIFHYGDPYRIKLYHTWEDQERHLFSGQVRQFFHLENTGVSSMLGIKLMPAAAYVLFGRDMSEFTDTVVPLEAITDLAPPTELIDNSSDWDRRINTAVQWLWGIIDTHETTMRIAPAIQQILTAHGMVDIESVANSHAISRRHLEREFRKIVGLTPKYFARIIQFRYIFEAMQRKDNAWVDVALNSGYFDQSHFIRNFREFTGESPAQYGFDQENIANFFLRK